MKRARIFKTIAAVWVYGGAVIAAEMPALAVNDGISGSLYPSGATVDNIRVADGAVPAVAQKSALKSAPSIKVTARKRAQAILQSPAKSVSKSASKLTKKPAAGSLYPVADNTRRQGPLAKSLGTAAYILSDVGQSETFRLRVQRAIGLHPVFHAQVSERAQARASAKAERAALYPRLSANLIGDYVVAREFSATTSNVVESLRPGGRFNAGLSASQLLFDGGATFQRIKGAKALDRESEQTMSARINDLALSALSAYHDVATHQAILRLGDAFIKRHTDLLNDVQERNRLGTGTLADVMRAKARLAAAKARVSQISESARLADIRYREFFNEAPGLLSRPSFEALSVSSREEAMAIAAGRNPEIAAAGARTEGARAAFKAERAGRFPELRANLNATTYDVLDGAEDYDVRAGVSMNYDLYAGGARGASISRARERAKQQQHEQERVRQEVVREAAIAYERKTAANERLELLADAVIAHYCARDLVAERFRVARGDLIDLLQAENDYFEAGVGYLSGLADRDMSAYGLMEYSGDLLRFFSPQTDYNLEDSVNG